ncbi:Heat shock protein 75 kDa, mitochondrial [Anabarilius grahami]|uniref:Heat shock protein 75 kDa, mitochondrial n=1 Tax=Anabarilius grahami TaxID=495550 RepID=A0A3N0XZQ4_ANAGA|nr:Heat shock protein 75 kDa, mitochondrial [Anabarilius grahami]
MEWLTTLPQMDEFHNCSGVFEVAEASGVRQGTKIVLHLKDDCKEFSSEDRVKEVVTKYSNFVSFSIFLNRWRLNTQQVCEV